LLNLRSEVELGLDHAAPDIATADAIGVGGAGDVEHTRGDADVVGNLELVPGFHGGGHATVLVPTGLVGDHGGYATDGHPSAVALQEHVLEVQSNHPAVHHSGIASIGLLHAKHAAVVASLNGGVAVGAGDAEVLSSLPSQGETKLVGIVGAGVHEGGSSKLRTHLAHGVVTTLVGVVGGEQPLLVVGLPSKLDRQTEAGVFTEPTLGHGVAGVRGDSITFVGQVGDTEAQALHAKALITEVAEAQTNTGTGEGGEYTSGAVEELKQGVLGVVGAAGGQHGVLGQTGTNGSNGVVADREAVEQLVDEQTGLSCVRPFHGGAVVGEGGSGISGAGSEAVGVVGTNPELELILTGEARVEVQIGVVGEREGVLIRNVVLVGGVGSQVTDELVS